MRVRRALRGAANGAAAQRSARRRERAVRRVEERQREELVAIRGDAPRSSADELRLGARREGLEGALEILGLHADRLRLRLRLDRLIECPCSTPG